MSKQGRHNTKFSHRLFSQYFISAIIPVIVLALISFYTVTELLEKNANRQIYAESRAVGLTLYDRILTIESNLLNISKSIDNKELIRSNDWAKMMYSSLYITDNEEHKEVLFGEDIITFELTYYQQNHLNNKKRLLLVHNSDNNQSRILMLHTLDFESNQILVAVLNPDYLWNITTKESDIYCAVVDRKSLVYCPGFIYQSDNLTQIKDQLTTVNKDGLYKLAFKSNQYLGNAWDLFIEPSFGMNAISIIYFMPKKDAFLEYDYYIDALPLSITITLLLVFILSSVQMRRSLSPLVSLTQGAKNIIAGDYTKTVDIKSNDEFEVLGETFNDMSHRIDEQIKKIKALAKIDRLILSTLDTENIVEVLIEYIPTIMPVDNIGILVLSQESQHNGTLFYNTDSFNDVTKTSLILSEPELNELINAEHIISKNNLDTSSYINPLIKSGNISFFIYPIRNQNEILGGICIGLSAEPDSNHDYSEDLTDISDRVAVAFSNANWEKKLFHQAHYDALTKLPNRYLFQDRLEQAIERAKRNELNVAMLFIDLDRFKSVNDSLGHVVGDDLLIEVSNVLLKCVRAYDSVARFGGDEFTIIISDLKDNEVEEQIEKLSNRILELMSEPIIINDREFHITPSIGIAIYPRDAKNLSDLLKNADTAMYEAKSNPTGNYQYYQKQQNKETLARLELENDLRHALEKDQLELYYQPKIDLRDCMIYDVEALIRWNHPDHGLVPPGDFIPLAEETGLITDIGYWVMKAACRQSKLWHEKGINLNIAVNISADQFRQPGLYDKVVNILDETEVNPGSIELEITESLTIENFPKTVRLLNQFREHGLGICIDDFGTGYSSMTYLQKIPINKLKIDKSFIDNIHLHDDSASITKAIVSLAHNLSLKVVAEGVETKAQYDYLNAINCDEAQGFFLCRPLPESELIQHILMYNSRSAKIN
jgi:diguanylate cyclase (GGDEF)-like protein